jgi:hypothetical protein
MTELSADERFFLRHLIKEHLDYYRTLGASPKCSASNQQKLQFYENLLFKLLEES